MCSASDKRQRQKILPQRTPRNSRNKRNAEEYCHGRCFHLQDTYASVAIKQSYVIYLGPRENTVLYITSILRSNHYLTLYAPIVTHIRFLPHCLIKHTGHENELNDHQR